MRVFLTGFAIASLTVSSAFAVDLGQYRPGTTYQSVIAPGADVCENHCSGDAQCRSWNYVKANPNAAGVCEFNSDVSQPVSSAISISGVNLGGASRRGIVSGSTNTIRVGTQPATSQPRMQPRIVSQNTPTRKIVREAVPQQKRAQETVNRTMPVGHQMTPRAPLSASLSASQAPNLAYQQNQQRIPVNPSPIQTPVIPQQFTYDLGGRPMAVPPLNAQTPITQSPTNRGYRPVQPLAPVQQQLGMINSQRPVQNYAPQTNQNMAMRDRRRQQGPRQMVATAPPNGGQTVGNLKGRVSGGQAYPPQGRVQPVLSPPQNGAIPHDTMQIRGPLNPAQPKQLMARRSADQPMTYRSPEQSEKALMKPALSPQALARGLNTEQAQQSLYGKLNDDIHVPNSGATVPTDPNLPIPTMTSRRTQPVEQGNLDDLAGPPKG